MKTYIQMNGIILLVAVLIGTNAVNAQTPFYYAYSNPIELEEMDNKGIVRFHQDISQPSANSVILSALESPMAFTLEQIDSKTYFILIEDIVLL